MLKRITSTPSQEFSKDFYIILTIYFAYHVSLNFHVTFALSIIIDELMHGIVGQAYIATIL